jgi:hypothetical protein
MNIIGFTKTVLLTGFVLVLLACASGSKLVIKSGTKVIKTEEYSWQDLISVEIPEGVIVISKEAFEGNELETLVIPHGVTSIGEGAFRMNNLTSVIIPDTVSRIASRAFTANKLKVVFIPESVKDLAEDAFDSYTAVIIMSSPKGEYAGDYRVLVENNRVAITEYRGKDTELVIPERINGLPVAVIGKYVFFEKGLASVVIPETVTLIEAGAFRRNSLTSVTIPGGLTAVADYVFAENELKAIAIPDNVTTIGKYAFGHNSIETIDIPVSVTSIGDAAFQFNSIANITIPDSVSRIGKYAFYGNSLSNIAVPKSLRQISENVFGKNEVTKVIIPDGVQKIDRYAFFSNKLTEIELPASITTLDETAFDKAVTLKGLGAPATLEISTKKGRPLRVKANRIVARSFILPGRATIPLEISVDGSGGSINFSTSISYTFLSQHDYLLIVDSKNQYFPHYSVLVQLEKDGVPEYYWLYQYAETERARVKREFGGVNPSSGTSMVLIKEGNGSGAVAW